MTACIQCTESESEIEPDISPQSMLHFCDSLMSFQSGCSEYQHRGSRSSYDATSRALGAQQDSHANMQKHFDSIQKISDTTTLPQMLIELERGLDRAANVDVLISELRSPLPCIKELLLSD